MRRLVMATLLIVSQVISTSVAEEVCHGEKMQDNDPIVEHPSGDYETAVQAITEAFRRLGECAETSGWVVLSGQGQGWRVDSYLVADVRYRNGTFVFPQSISEVASIAARVGLAESQVEIGSDSKTVSIRGATPALLAAFLDAVYREALGIRPHEGEDDYAFGAEWL